MINYIGSKVGIDGNFVVGFLKRQDSWKCEAISEKASNHRLAVILKSFRTLLMHTNEAILINELKILLNSNIKLNIVAFFLLKFPQDVFRGLND